MVRDRAFMHGCNCFYFLQLFLHQIRSLSFDSLDYSAMLQLRMPLYVMDDLDAELLISWGGIASTTAEQPENSVGHVFHQHTLP